MFSLWCSAVVSIPAVAFVRAVAGVLDVAVVLAFANIPADPAIPVSGCPYIGTVHAQFTVHCIDILGYRTFLSFFSAI
jgi:hypothetical protein